MIEHIKTQENKRQEQKNPIPVDLVSDVIRRQFSSALEQTNDNISINLECPILSDKEIDDSIDIIADKLSEKVTEIAQITDLAIYQEKYLEEKNRPLFTGDPFGNEDPVYDKYVELRRLFNHEQIAILAKSSNDLRSALRYLLQKEQNKIELLKSSPENLALLTNGINHFLETHKQLNIDIPDLKIDISMIGNVGSILIGTIRGNKVPIAISHEGFAEYIVHQNIIKLVLDFLNNRLFDQSSIFDLKHELRHLLSFNEVTYDDGKTASCFSDWAKIIQVKSGFARNDFTRMTSMFSCINEGTSELLARYDDVRQGIDPDSFKKTDYEEDVRIAIIITHILGRPTFNVANPEIPELNDRYDEQEVNITGLEKLAKLQSSENGLGSLQMELEKKLGKYALFLCEKVNNIRKLLNSLKKVKMGNPIEASDRIQIPLNQFEIYEIDQDELLSLYPFVEIQNQDEIDWELW